jgi:hypothetical protein
MRSYPGNDLDLGKMVGIADHLRLSRRDRARHTYMVGATRTGKTKLMEGMVRQDLLAWPNYHCPVVVLDPHGTFFDSIIEFVAAANLHRFPIIPIDLRRNDLVVSYNLLRRREGADAGVIVRGFVQAILHAWGQSNSNETPRLATWLETLLMLAYERECTLTEALEIIRNPDLRSLIVDDVQHLVARTTLKSAQRLREPEFQDRVESTLYRINRFLGTALMRATLCQTGASLDLDRVLADGSILLVTTSTEGTQIAEEDAAAFGSILMTDLWTAARRRGKREEGKIRPAYCYVDEFQNFVSPSIARGLAEASGYGLHLTLAHQFPSQLTDQGEIGQMILNSVLANAKNKICFQLSHPEDLEMLSLLLFRQHVDPDKIKSEIHGTKVLGHNIQYMSSYSSGTNQSETKGVQWSDTVGKSTSHTDQWSHTDGVSDAVTTGESFTESDSTSSGSGSGQSESQGFDPEDDSEPLSMQRGSSSNDSESSGSSSSRTTSYSETHTFSASDTHGEADTEGRSTARTDGGSKGTSVGVSSGVTSSPMLIPVLGKELSSRQFVSIPEQLFKYAQFLDGLPDRHCVVRTASSNRMVPLYTHTIKKPLTTVKFARGFIARSLGKLTYVLAMSDALERIAKRERTFVETILYGRSPVTDEVQTARRVRARVREDE